MKDAELTRLADANLAESLREFARWGHSGEVFERDDILCTLAPDAFPGTNAALRTGPDAAPSAEVFLERTAAYYAGQQRRAYSIRARGALDEDLAALCRARGFYLVSENPGMVIDAPIADLGAPPCELRVATSEADVDDFARVCAASYATVGLPEASALPLFARKRALLSPHVHIVVAYDGAEPISTALAFLSHGLGGVYWVGTAPSARRKKIAPHCARAVTNWALSRGASHVVLQASKQGEPIYRALGYREITRYPWFIRVLQPGEGSSPT